MVNNAKNKHSKSYLSIFCQNIFTFFNLIWAVIFFSLIFVGAYTDLLFIIPIVLNTVISIVQEIRAKITVERLSLVSAPRVSAIRDGKRTEIFTEKLVLDDVVCLELGNQIPADSVVLQGTIEVNESLLTGESRPVKKQEGDFLYAGSFLVSGSCFARIDKIGKESYIQSVAAEAKKFKSPNSNLLRDIKAFFKYLAIIVVPVGVLMLINNYYAYDKNIYDAVTKTCGALTGMVPAGMYLLITIALSMGVIKLSRKHTLVQDIYSLEMLARTNVLCLDKTGTITDGTMEVNDFIILDKSYDYNEIIPNVLCAQSHNNNTANAMIEYFGKKQTLSLVQSLAFSSKRKMSAAQFEEYGTFVLGAPEFVCKKLSPELLEIIKSKTTQGQRVLLLAKTDEEIDDQEKFSKTKPLALISIVDHIREDAIETIKWFKDNDVQIKIISGDDPVTVSNIAARVGVANANQCVSLDGMSLPQVAKIADNFTVFGRVSPEQKHTLIKSLKNQGFVVAMTGDGVNDTLALKEADCSIAMADGSEVARNISNLVLMDSKFSSLPAVVKEGRQVVNNVQNSSVLFLMKTFFTIMLSLITLFTLSQYAYSPKQLLLIELFVIGAPSVILALQPNDKLIKGEFLPQVMIKAIPRGILMLLNILVVMGLSRFGAINADEFQTLSTIVLASVGFLNLCSLCFPLNALRTTTIIASLALMLFSCGIFYSLFGIVSMSWKVIVIWLCLVLFTIPLTLFSKRIEIYVHKLLKRFKKKGENND